MMKIEPKSSQTTTPLWYAKNTLKLLLLVGAFMAMASITKAQDYFYYYKGEKQKLELNTKYLYLVTDVEGLDIQKQASPLMEGLEISKTQRDNSTQKLASVANKSAETIEFWAEAKLNIDMSSKEYLDYIKNLKGANNIKLTAPYFQNGAGEKIGLSQYFYVKLKKEGDFNLLQEFAGKTNTIVAGRNKFMPLWYTMKCSESSTLNALENANLFYESGQFEFAEPDFLIENITNTPNDPLFPNQWGLNNTGQYGGTNGIDINALDAWDITKGSSEVVVAVLDHGFEMNHPDLAGNVFGTGFDTGSGTSPAQVLGNHGTACAGIIGAPQDNNLGLSGIAPNTRLMSISQALVLSPTVQQELADGINWAWQNGADIISNSWGSNSLASALIDNAITNALTNGRNGLGTIVVFATGNSNNAVTYPASSNPDIIAVGASDDCGLRVDPSSGSSCLSWNSFQGSCFGNELDVMAPGAMIETTDLQGNSGYSNNDYTSSFGGTSSACPAVAGVAALVLGVNPCLTHDEVEDIIEQTAQKVGGYAYNNTVGRPNGTWNNEMGYGLVDAEAAVLLAQSMLSDQNAADLYTKDRPYDTGVEPNPDGGPMWISEDVWVRQNPDGGLTHQNPEFKNFSPNAIYVRVRNRGSVTSDCANLSLYFSKASTGLNWPIHWNNYVQTGVLHGDKINTVSIPPIAPGGSYIAEILWYPPNPNDFTNDIHHFCLLSRIEALFDPMANEQNNVGVSTNVRNNNNIAWKNVSVYDNDISNDAFFTSVFIRGVQRSWSYINLRFFDQGFEDKIRVPFFDRGGELYFRVGDRLYERIKEADLDDIEQVDENIFLVKSRKAAIYGLPINSKETFSLDIGFRVEMDQGEEVLLDVVQENAETREFEGGERFLIRETEDKKSFINTPSTLEEREVVIHPNPTASDLYVDYNVDFDDSEVEISIYNIYDSQKTMSIHSGKKAKGAYSTKYNVSTLEKGIYIVKVKVGDKVYTDRVVVK